jgi:hypothetical protein
MILGHEAQIWLSADLPHHDSVLLAEAVGRARIRRIRHARQEIVATSLGGVELLLEAREVRLDALELRELLGFPLSLRRARSSSTRGCIARTSRSAARSSSKIPSAPLRTSALRKPSGSVRAARRSIMQGV